MTLIEKTKINLIKEYCKVVRNNITEGMEVSSGFLVLLNMIEELLQICNRWEPMFIGDPLD